MIPLPTRPYLDQAAEWPARGRHILAHYDEETIVVYQAYRAEIADFAVAHGRFGGPFSFSRMSWIKPNFLWMMYRSNWATSEGQERVLGLRIRLPFFEQILEAAVASSQSASRQSEAAWREALSRSEVRLQWDPDHGPSGAPLERRAIQLGLRGKALRAFATEELREVIDMTDFVSEQRRHARPSDWALLETPSERVFVPRSAAAARNVTLDMGGNDAAPPEP